MVSTVVDFTYRENVECVLLTCHVVRFSNHEKFVVIAKRKVDLGATVASSFRTENEEGYIHLSHYCARR